VNILTHDYEVRHYADTAKVELKGTLRLNAAPEYAPISDLLDHALATAQKVLTVDVRELKFLNSSGINLLYQFVLKVKKNAMIELQFEGSNLNAWQPKSLANMSKFMPSIRIHMHD
jgi:hypothetical protein